MMTKQSFVPMLVGVALLFVAGCKTAKKKPIVENHPGPLVMKPRFPPDASGWSHYEGERAANDCTLNSDCKVTGCNKEICAAEEVVSACGSQGMAPPEAGCYCVKNVCIWAREEHAWE